MPLQRFIIGRMPSLAKVVRSSIAFKVSRGSHGTTAPLAPYETGRVPTPNSHSSEQGTLLTVSLISK
jgi:hypothetical protein